MTTDTVQRNFLGIPIEGDISRGERKSEQRPLSELEPLLRAVVDDPTIASFGWNQYTPYFNDGDPCIFRVGEAWFRTVDDPAFDSEEAEEEAEDTYGLWGHPTLGKREYHWVDRARVSDGYVGPDEARFDRCNALKEALGSEAFDNVLLEAFGDHANIVITAKNITVDEYSHD